MESMNVDIFITTPPAKNTDIVAWLAQHLSTLDIIVVPLEFLGPFEGEWEWLLRELTKRYNITATTTVSNQSNNVTFCVIRDNDQTTDGMASTVDSFVADSVPESVPETSMAVTGAGGTQAESQRRPPRPMNCWMLFRDEKHRQLKTENPGLSVQQISTIVSRLWKDLSKDGKAFWHAEADRAKDWHKRMYPNYKYTPRRPGEKKKRQSRKVINKMPAAPVIQAVGMASASAPAGLEVFDFNSFPDANASGFGIPASISDIPTFCDNSNMDFSDFTFPEVATAIASTFEETYIRPEQRPEHLNSTEDVMESEADRMRRLDLEFMGAGFTTGQDGEESVAFRDGADDNVILPNNYSDSF